MNLPKRFTSLLVGSVMSSFLCITLLSQRDLLTHYIFHSISDNKYAG